MTKVILTATQASSNFKKKSELKIKTSKYIEFLIARKMIHKFLTCDRIILVPMKVQEFSALELSNKLNISPIQLKRLQSSRIYYKQLIGKVNPLLAKLYCGTEFV